MSEFSEFSEFDHDELNEKLNEFLKYLEKTGRSTLDNKERLLLESLHIHQIELEMQNRELKSSQEDLEKSRDKYADLFDFAPIGYASFNKNGVIEEINLTACKLLGSERSTLLGKPFSVFLTLSDSMAFFKHIKKIISSAEKSRIKLQLKSLAGIIYHIQIESTLRISDNGDKIIQSAIVDISDHVAAEQALSESKNQLHLIINALPVLVAQIDLHIQLIFSNKAYDKSFADKKKRKTDRHLIDRIGNENFALLEPYIKVALEGHEVSCEVALTIGSQKISYHVNLLPNPDAHGTVNNFFMIMIDISTYKQNELASMTHLTSLAHEARIYLIGQMTTEIAHEINQPLSAIANYSAAGIRLQNSEKLEVEDITAILNDIDEQVHRASNIINHLKKFSKKRDLQLSKTNINALIQEVLTFLVAEKPRHGIKIQTTLNEPIPYTHVDTILIEQVLLNILRNAVEALIESQQKKPLITVKTASTDNEILILIADNGPGLSYELLDGIFRPFFSTKESGIGLGLSICKSIIESHHGNLWATRNAEMGTTFHIQLPISNQTLQPLKKSK